MCFTIYGLSQPVAFAFILSAQRFAPGALQSVREYGSLFVYVVCLLVALAVREIRHRIRRARRR